MNTFHLGTMSVIIGGMGMLAAGTLSLPATAANTVKTMAHAEKDQAIVTNYMDNQGNSGYVKHNHTSMDNAWDYFNPLNHQAVSGSATSSASATAGSGVNPGGPVNAGSGDDSSATTSATSTSSTGTVPQVPSPLRRIIMGDVAHTLHVIKAHWRSNNSDESWTPTGTNWQADWSNWNPTLWERHGSTYANWSEQLGAYLSARFPSYASQIEAVGL